MQMDRKNSRKSVSSQQLPAPDPKVLKELAKMAQGLPPDKGMELILKNMEKIDPSLHLPGNSSSPYNKENT